MDWINFLPGLKDITKQNIMTNAISLNDLATYTSDLLTEDILS